MLEISFLMFWGFKKHKRLCWLWSGLLGSVHLHLFDLQYI